MAEVDRTGSTLVAGVDRTGSSLMAHTLLDFHHCVAEVLCLSRPEGAPEDFLVHIYFSKLLFIRFSHYGFKCLKFYR